MVGVAAELGSETRLPDNSRHGRDGQALGFQNRALLDVHLDETERVRIERCIADQAWVEPKFANGLLQCDTVRVLESEQC